MYRIMYCTNCGRELAENAIMCPQCGAPTKNTNPTPANVSDKDWLTALLLCLFLGPFGIHSFYAGKTGIGIAQLFTLGGCGIWALVDLIMIICGSFKDDQGKLLINRR